MNYLSKWAMIFSFLITLSCGEGTSRPKKDPQSQIQPQQTHQISTQRASLLEKDSSIVKKVIYTN